MTEPPDDIRAELAERLRDAEFALRRMRERGAETSCADDALLAAREGLRDAAPEPPPSPKPVAASAPMSSPTPDAARRLIEIREDLGDCKRCKLHADRTNIVFGVGSPKAELMFVGEGPGADEDAKGEPFVGRAGQLLTKMIEAMGVRRSDVYIANVVKCRPPGNRAPAPDEVAACSPFLRAQIHAIRPRVICTLGNAATAALLQKPEGITKLRGVFQEYEGIPVMPTYHPAFLLRSPDKKRDAWNDLQQIMTHLGWERPDKA